MTRFSFLSIAALALAGMLAAGTPVWAAGGESGTITGTVVDPAGVPVSGATVIMKAPSGTYRAHTGRNGKFTALGVFADTYSVSVENGGVVQARENGVAIDGDQIVDLGTITLSQPPK